MRETYKRRCAHHGHCAINVGSPAGRFCASGFQRLRCKASVGFLNLHPRKHAALNTADYFSVLPNSV